VKNELVDITLDSTLNYIDGQSAQTIINYQADATFQALIEQAVPGAKISLETPNAYNIGELIAFIQSCVYYICLLLDVNWANNPRVNIGKKICNKALLNKMSSQERKNIRISNAYSTFNDFY
jgi:glucose-6-phosphate isomerase